MAKKTINLGTGELTGDGESIRSAFDKINDNFDELYAQDANDVVLSAINASLIPDTDVTYDLGSATNRFRDLYLSGSTIDLGGTTLSVVGGELQLGGVKVPTTADVAATVASAVSTPTGDLTGSVFADDSTLLVDGVAGKLVGAIDTAQQARFTDSIVLQNGNDIVTIGDAAGASFQLPNKGVAFLGGGVDGGSYNIAFTANGNGSILVTEQLNILSGAGMALGTVNGLTINNTVNVDAAVTAPSFVGDLTGSVFADDSTILVDGVNGRIVAPVYTNYIESSYYAGPTGSTMYLGGGANYTILQSDIWTSQPAKLIDSATGTITSALIQTDNITVGVGGGINMQGADIGAAGTIGATTVNANSVYTNTIIPSGTTGGALNIDGGLASTGDGGDVTINGGQGENAGDRGWVRLGTDDNSTVTIGSSNSTQIGIGKIGQTTTTVYGDTDFREGDVTFNGVAISFAEQNSITPSIDFADTSIQNLAPGNVYANSGQFLYVTSKHSGGSATNVAFTYDASNSRPSQTFYGKTEFGGLAPIVDFDGVTVENWSDPNVVNKAGASAKLSVGGNTATMDFLTVRIAENTPGELDVEFNYDPSSGTVAVSANGDLANRFSGTTNFTAGNTTWTVMNVLTTVGDKGEMTIVDHSGHYIYRITTFAGEMPGVNPGDAYCVIERLK